MIQAAPLTDANRLPWIDTARGFAILGIFLVNLPSFHGPYFLYGNMNNYWGNRRTRYLASNPRYFLSSKFLYVIFVFVWLWHTDYFRKLKRKRSTIST
ncbi:hypothetical protein [Gracilibacillus boraciitolerans]|uniref:hypothetical protein n=1 Tax=Gracilibacillus boraciitolerans TaxID=307521 RepID=UPI0011DDF388|nr:hypothetical protein [Gracilibacillus boraciitolerans]